MRERRHQDRARRRALVALLAGALLTAGCPGDGPGPVPPPRPRVRVRSFTEASPVRLIAVALPWAFTASGQGLDRWDLRTGQGLHLDAQSGLPGDRVQALAADTRRGWVWIATSGGVTRYEAESGSFKPLAPAPRLLGLDEQPATALETAEDGGLWLGHPRGLFHASSTGQWSPTAVTAPVTGLVRSRDGRLWIGTRTGLIVRETSGQTFQYGPDNGCDLASIRFLARAPDGGPLMVGDDAQGRQRIALAGGDGCLTYRAAPDERWLAAAAVGSRTVIMTGSRLFALRSRDDPGARQLSREGMRLVPVNVGGATAPASPWVVRVVDAPLPEGAVSLAGGPDEVLVGTRDTGTARIALAGRGPARWLRRGELVDEARALSVACERRDRCLVATGAPWAWSFDGERFRRVGDPGVRVLGFVRARNGDIWGLRHGDPGQIVLARIKQEVWLRTSEIQIRTPGTDPAITFARFSPSGVLWVGLRYRDAHGEERPFGVALVDTSLGAVVYHHASRDDREVKQGVLPIPIDVVDAAFMDDDESWLASSEGAARVRPEAVQVFTEAEGMRSELLRGIACSAGGVVFVASGEGVGLFDGEQWSYPRTLRAPVNDIELGADGRLWMATDRGLAVYDGRRVRRLDQRRGLLEDEIGEVALDHLGRVWVRGEQGITIITP